MEYSLGIDIGSSSIKALLLDCHNKVIYRDYKTISTSSLECLKQILTKLKASLPIDQISHTGYSGGIDVNLDNLGWFRFTDSLAIARGVLHRHPDAGSIIYIGGQTILVIELEDGLNKPWKAITNPLCAAGTGRFMDQQAYRLGVDMEEFSSLALAFNGQSPRIATRCSVFAKSDLIHLQQKGVAVEAMLYALCESIGRMVVSLKKGIFKEPVYLVGGVAANKAVHQALSDNISRKNGKPVFIHIPDDPLYSEALGLAILAQSKPACPCQIPTGEGKKHYHQLPALPQYNEDVSAAIQTVPCNGLVYLGVDVGSTSTKAVIINEQGQVVAKDYLMTAGRPVEAVKQVFRNLIAKGSAECKVAGAGVTGSGRYLVGSLIGADLIKNEITAQVRAAREIDPDADIIEIGGQDSKLVIKRNGIVVDYQMNKACAAGTGSFIDELAELLGVPVKNGDFARLALSAPHTLDLGTRCAAFMSQAVSAALQQHVPVDVITASLAVSIAKNYLFKVVGSRKLGNRIILTGAVFHNKAIVSAFRQALDDKTITVAEHREVSGAIGAALLAKEANTCGQSHFSGFKEVIDSECNLSSFICTRCDNNCTITRMQLSSGQNAYFGSRCDLYDATHGTTRVKTAFDEREQLLLSNVCDRKGSLCVGIPRGLLFYDYAPMLINFLNYLGVEVALSGKTTKSIMEKAIELSYSDSCFPLKLLHGHIDNLGSADYILFPCAIRLGEKEKEQNQQYSCPLVQASPFIVRQVFGLENRLLIPFIDFSRGDQDVISSFTGIATRMGFSHEEGNRAALAALAAQQQFQREMQQAGSRLLDDLHRNGKIGVVILARSYISQDAGANLGIAEKLAQLGVVPIPVDMLPLDTVDTSLYSDRPYWAYENKFIAATSLITSDPQLFGLALTNFGCGPDSFILKILEDISGSKPLGQLEMDEHAAEAGMVTRLEAFVDTISGYFASSGASNDHITEPDRIYRGASAHIAKNKTILIPYMAAHAEVLAAAMQAYGVDARILPEANESDLLYANEVTAGTECLPYRVTLGGFIRFTRENPASNGAQGFMSGSYGPCRLGKYAIEQGRILKKLGIDLPLCTTVSNNAYRDLGLGPGFERLAWKGIVAVDRLERMLWHSRPYSIEPDRADRLFSSYLTRITGFIRNQQDYSNILKEASESFKAMVSEDIDPRPVIGINGEIFLRSNRFSNNNLARACEKAGLEVVVSPMSEWLKYTTHRNLEDAVKDRNFKKIFSGYIKKMIQDHDEQRVLDRFADNSFEPEPSTRQLLELSSGFLSARCGSEAVLSLGSGVEWMQSPHFAGVISVMPHGCMPGGIVAAMSEKFSNIFNKPWINLTYDGFLESNNLQKIENFAEIIRYCHPTYQPNQ